MELIMNYGCSTGKTIELYPRHKGGVFYNEIKSFTHIIKRGSLHHTQ